MKLNVLCILAVVGCALSLPGFRDKVKGIGRGIKGAAKNVRNHAVAGVFKGYSKSRNAIDHLHDKIHHHSDEEDQQGEHKIKRNKSHFDIGGFKEL